ncbi:ribbon-helix-helix domain-containing protein [Sphingomonas sp. PB4P5]|uniref:ribbon-helix-helix domain-containing protein n=1 Tax=Parasphingomonas puruogangriensis TaxID=3096155 RepID=UPI002FC8AA4E
MDADRTFHIALDAEMATIVDGVVDSGEFPSAEDVVRMALDEWWQSRNQTPETIAYLRRAWEEGLASGPAIEGNFDLEDIKRRGMARLAAARAAE